MIKKCIVCLFLIFCVFFVGLAIVEADEGSYKTFTVAELVNVINNGEYTTKDKSENPTDPYFIAEASGNDLVLKLSSDLSKSITLKYNSSDNSLKYEEETSDEHIGKIQLQLFDSFMWILEASGSTLEESAKIINQMVVESEKEITYELIGYEYEVSASGSNDSMSSKALLRFELNDKMYRYGKNLLDNPTSDTNTDVEGTNPNTGSEGYFWIALVALIGVFLVLLSQKNIKIFKI